MGFQPIFSNRREPGSMPLANRQQYLKALDHALTAYRRSARRQALRSTAQHMPSKTKSFVVASMILPFDKDLRGNRVWGKRGILVVQNHKGGWEVPGGGVDRRKDTTLYDTAKRELIEEVGLIPGMDYSLTYKGTTKSGDTTVWETIISRGEYKTKADRANWDLIHKGFAHRQKCNGTAEHTNIGFVYCSRTERGPKLFVLTATGKPFPNANLGPAALPSTCGR